MNQQTEPHVLEPHESRESMVERPAVPAVNPPPAIAGPERSERNEHTEQSSQSAAGAEQRERVVTDSAGVHHSARTVRDVGAERRLNLNTVSRVIVLFFGVVEGLIGLRVILKVIGANPNNDFALFIYNAAALFLAPFFGLVGSPSSGGMVLEVPSIIAMLFYGVVGWLIVRVILPLFDRPTMSSTSTYDRFDS
jgi:hypothetical protein